MPFATCMLKISWKDLHWKCKLYNLQCISFDDGTHSSNAFFLRRYGPWSKYREGSWSYPVVTGNPKNEAMVLEGHIKKVLFDMLLFVMKLSCYSCYSVNIPSNDCKVRNQDAWLCWFSVICLHEKKILSALNMCPISFRKGGLQVSIQGGYQEGGMIPCKLCWWCGIWSL